VIEKDGFVIPEWVIKGYKDLINIRYNFSIIFFYNNKIINENNFQD
jgi:hypothetical protein